MAALVSAMQSLALLLKPYGLVNLWARDYCFFRHLRVVHHEGQTLLNNNSYQFLLGDMNEVPILLFSQLQAAMQILILLCTGKIYWKQISAGLNQYSLPFQTAQLADRLVQFHTARLKFVSVTLFLLLGVIIYVFSPVAASSNAPLLV